MSAHRRALTLGGLDGLLNPGMIESALARPYTGYYRTIAEKAAAFTESMATNHGFYDGNKRTTLILLHTLLTKSGYRLVTRPDDNSLEDAAEAMILAVVNGDLEYASLLSWFRARIQRI